MFWVEKPPRESGLYWRKDTRGKLSLLMVVTLGGGAIEWFGYDLPDRFRIKGSNYTDTSFGEQWMGPIEVAPVPKI